MSYLDPPEVYEWPYCQEYGWLLGDDDGTVVLGPDSCPTCPMRHRCKDGILTITGRRMACIENACADCIDAEMRGEAPPKSCRECEVSRRVMTGAV